MSQGSCEVGSQAFGARQSALHVRSGCEARGRGSGGSETKAEFSVPGRRVPVSRGVSVSELRPGSHFAAERVGQVARATLPLDMTLVLHGTRSQELPGGVSGREGAVV